MHWIYLFLLSICLLLPAEYSQAKAVAASSVSSTQTTASTYAPTHAKKGKKKKQHHKKRRKPNALSIGFFTLLVTFAGISFLLGLFGALLWPFISTTLGSIFLAVPAFSSLFSTLLFWTAKDKSISNALGEGLLLLINYSLLLIIGVVGLVVGLLSLSSILLLWSAAFILIPVIFGLITLGRVDQIDTVQEGEAL